MRKYFSSKDWENAAGIILSDCNSKKEQHDRIKKLGLPCLDFIIVNGNGQQEAREFIGRHSPVVLVATPGDSDRLRKHVELGVKSYGQFEAFVKKTKAGGKNGHYSYFIGDMIEPAQDSYVGTAISDGKGRLFCEFYKKPFMTEIRELTAGVCDTAHINHLLVEEFDTIVVSPSNIPSLDLRYLINELPAFTGYFEFIKGIKAGKLGLYFIQYERTNAFSNVLQTVNSLNYDLEKRVENLVNNGGGLK